MAARPQGGYHERAVRPLTAGRREKAWQIVQKLDKKLQDSFPKFYYKQKVLEDMIVVTDGGCEVLSSSRKDLVEV